MKSFFKNATRIGFSLVMLGAILIFGGLKNTKAQVSVDNASDSAAFSGTGVSTLTWSHTVGGTNRALFVGISTAATTLGSPLARVTSVTFGAQTLTRVAGGFQLSPDLNNAVELFVLVSPNSGTNAITVNLSPLASNYVVGGAISFSGVNQTTPTGDFVSTSNAFGVPSNTATISVPDSTADDLILDVIGTGFNAQNIIPGAAQTRRWRQLDSLPSSPMPFYVGAGSTKSGASGSVSMTWTLQIAQNWALGAIAVKAAPPATSSEVTIGGRITTASGKSISRAFVIIIDSTGAKRTTQTNPSGYYRFLEVPSGATYILEARSKRYTFNPKILSVNEENVDLNFVANP